MRPGCCTRCCTSANAHAECRGRCACDDRPNFDFNQDLEYVLKHGRECGVRVLAATANLEVERSALVDWFDSRIVFALEDEEASVRLLGKPWAITLAEPGRALARIGRRREMELQAVGG